MFAELPNVQSGNIIYYLSFQGKQVKMKDSQLSTKWIGKVFGLYPDSIILVGDDDTIEIPDEYGSFTGLKRFTDYEVQGDSTKLPISPSGSGSSQHAFVPIPKRGKDIIVSTARSGDSGKRWNPLSLSRGKTNKPPGVTMSDNKVKQVICQKTMEIHAFKDSCQAVEKVLNYPLELTTATANISSVSEILSTEVFNGEPCVLLDVDNLKIPDSSTTRGTEILLIVVHDNPLLTYL